MCTPNTPNSYYKSVAISIPPPQNYTAIEHNLPADNLSLFFSVSVYSSFRNTEDLLVNIQMFNRGVKGAVVLHVSAGSIIDRVETVNLCEKLTRNKGVPRVLLNPTANKVDKQGGLLILRAHLSNWEVALRSFRFEFVVFLAENSYFLRPGLAKALRGYDHMPLEGCLHTGAENDKLLRALVQEVSYGEGHFCDHKILLEGSFYSFKAIEGAASRLLGILAVDTYEGKLHPYPKEEHYFPSLVPLYSPHGSLISRRNRDLINAHFPAKGGPALTVTLKNVRACQHSHCAWMIKGVSRRDDNDQVRTCFRSSVCATAGLNSTERAVA